MLKGKPVGILGASPGVAGTSRAQIGCQILAYNQAETMLSMELLVNNAAERFDDDLVLTDEESTPGSWSSSWACSLSTAGRSAQGDRPVAVCLDPHERRSAELHRTLTGPVSSSTVVMLQVRISK
ncbi:MAG: hypothetical protein R2716_00370 [Microthrixaceae bacterium]